MKKILLVDDNNENLYLLETIFNSKGYDTITAKNGAEAIKLMQEDLPDLIISDILMPTMDGFTFCIECKKDKKIQQIPFIFYTATYTGEKDGEFALSLGADKFITKPIDPVEFARIISEVLEEQERANFKSTAKAEVNETVVLKQYNQVLVKKLEDKLILLKTTNNELKRYQEKLEDIVKERTKQLELKIKRLKEFNKLFNNREFRMRELKDKVIELERKLAQK
ncbi:MAG: response regulator [Candidatus Cloacimonetes bacterium]|nr:response regulator [Candidatus Cloacimonadota bacterium]